MRDAEQGRNDERRAGAGSSRGTPTAAPERRAPGRPFEDRSRTYATSKRSKVSQRFSTPTRSDRMTRVQLSYQSMPQTASSMMIFCACLGGGQTLLGVGLVVVLVDDLVECRVVRRRRCWCPSTSLWNSGTMWKNGSFTHDCQDSIESCRSPLEASWRKVASVWRVMLILKPIFSSSRWIQTEASSCGCQPMRIGEVEGDRRGDARLLHQRLGLLEVVLVGRERAVVAGHQRRQRRGHGRAVAHQHVGHDRRGRDGVVDRLPHLDVVERLLGLVHRHPVAGRVGDR